MGRLDNWYKNRINRIYPTVFAWAIISSALLLSDKTMVEVVLYGGGWFVSAIMVYYIIFYFIKKYFISRLYIPIGIVVVLLLVWSLFIHDSSSFTQIYSSSSFSSRIIGFFNMLLGACIGKYSVEYNTKGGSFLAYLIISVLCLVAYYGSLHLCSRFPALYVFQVVSIIPLVALVYSLYRLFNTDVALNLYNKRYIHSVVFFVGSLCLEMYICQFVLITDKYNNLFPLNVILIFPVVVLVAYSLRGAARIFSQTFKEGDYNWKFIFGK